MLRTMWSRSTFSLCLLAITTFLHSTHAHTVITYPGWRGDNLRTNGTVNETNGLSGYAPGADGPLYPYGMQWQYPCGGMPISTNRTKWPVKGGAFAFQPGWFQGHKTAYLYINLGLGTYPINYSLPMLNGVQLIGPTKEAYPGTFCFPQVPLPANVTVNVGDNATIQVIEAAIHGAALYNCVDITFADPEDVADVNETNCFNSSQISSNLIFTTDSLTSESTSLSSARYSYISAAMAVVFAYALM